MMCDGTSICVRPRCWWGPYIRIGVGYLHRPGTVRHPPCMASYSPMYVLGPI